MTKALPPASEEEEQLEQELAEFNTSWERANELRSVVTRLPNQLVLKSGLSARRNNLLGRWSDIGVPELDGTLPELALEGLRQWIHDAEVLISYIVKTGREVQEHKHPSPDGRVYSGPPVEPGDLPQVIDSIDEADGVSDEWGWPWTVTAIAKKKKDKIDASKVIKFAAAGAFGVIAIMAYFEEDM